VKNKEGVKQESALIGNRNKKGRADYRKSCCVIWVSYKRAMNERVNISSYVSTAVLGKTCPSTQAYKLNPQTKVSLVAAVPLEVEILRRD